MKAAIFGGKGIVNIGERPDPVIRESTDAIVRVVRSCVCGSDLWYYRGLSPRTAGGPIGHEFIGVVDKVGKDVKNIADGDFVISPFTYNDGTCINCKKGWQANCIHGGVYGTGYVDGGQGEMVSVTLADGTLVRVKQTGFSEEKLRSMLALSDVMCTGHHAAVSAGVKEGGTVAVVGDGAVGLCAVIASKRLGAKRIISISRNPSRQKLAREFGATDIVPERGDAAIQKVLELTDGFGADAAMECVGTGESMNTAFGIARVGAVVGAVGVPHEVRVPIETAIFRNVGLRGGIAPARKYIPELLDDALSGRINPGRVFDMQTDIEHIADAYKAMDERRAVKAILNISDI